MGYSHNRERGTKRGKRTGMRAQELLRINHANDTTTLRNILLHFNHIVLLNEYNKSEAVKDKPFVVARYLPEAMSQIVIAYLAEVKPTRDLTWCTRNHGTVSQEISQRAWGQGLWIQA
ncbi:hypothetical protein EMPG_11712 [Blastomyces silverae]|uniref:Uncharacterized protein n=1 Tax=Blastomyces silverae TaxID=2060906 RepID=A0A0H1BQN4_9EURO|nr:hypothetical protein EMPG_11712 [Blastomyces silverae]